MDASTVESLKKILQDLESEEQIEESAVISRDGLIIADSIKSFTGINQFCASIALMMHAAEKASDKAGKGKIDKIELRVEKGLIMACRISPRATLVVMTRGEGSARISTQMDKAVNSIRKILE